MINVSILVPETAVIEAVADPHYIFTAVNNFLIAAGKEPLFELQLVGLTKTVILNNCLFTVTVNKLISEVDKTDLIFIPAISGDIDTALSLNKAFISWIVEQYKGGAEVASLCIGAFLLASTGLLNGKKCSTHWNAADQFRNRFPDVELVDGKVVTEDHGIYTSGGANSYWSLLLHLVEKFTDRETAILASKYFVVDIDKNCQSSFAIFKGQKEHNDEAVKDIQDFIEKNIEHKITVETLANKVAVGRRSFERRFKRATHNSVLTYIQRVKIEAAKRSFESSRKNINEVMYEVGYTDTKAFRTTFKKITGVTPVEYRNKYNKLSKRNSYNYSEN